jgi:hypothetical protein
MRIPGLTRIAFAVAAAFIGSPVQAVEERESPTSDVKPYDLYAPPENPVFMHTTKEQKLIKARAYYRWINPSARPEEFDEEKRPWLQAFSDAETIADLLADPEKVAKWMNVINDPYVVYVMASCAQEPVMWEVWMEGLGNPGKLLKAALRFADPTVYLKWLASPTLPGVWDNLLANLDSEKYARWTLASQDPKFYSPAYNWLDSRYLGERTEWAIETLLDPQFWLYWINPLNPAAYLTTEPPLPYPTHLPPPDPGLPDTDELAPEMEEMPPAGATPPPEGAESEATNASRRGSL